MIVVKIIGDLGNQLFQYAYAKSLSEKGYDVKLDISAYKNKSPEDGFQLHQYKIDLKTASPSEIWFAKYFFNFPLKEKSLLFQKNLLKPFKNKYVHGFFKTEHYFEDIRPTLLKQFVVKKQLASSTIEFLEEITIKKNTCAIYINTQKTKKSNAFCDLNYYKKALKFVREKCGEMSFFVFSDDIVWAKKNLKIKNAVYVQHEVIAHENLHLMSLCKHNILANCSFSWWSAWLNRNQNKIIIAPKKWIENDKHNIVCKNWIQL